MAIGFNSFDFLNLDVADASWDDGSAEAWGDIWQESVSPNFEAAPFADTHDLGVDDNNLAQSWTNMHEWADLTFHLQPECFSVEEIELETEAAGGRRFCCYGSVSRDPINFSAMLTFVCRSQTFTSNWSEIWPTCPPK